MKLIKLFFVSLLFWLPTACNLTDDIERELFDARQQTSLALTGGINALENTSVDVVAVLRDVDKQMDQQIQKTLSYNIPYIINLAENVLASTILCVQESAKEQAIYYLELLRAELITGVLPPLMRTKICAVSHATLNLKAPISTREHIEYVGYAIHTKDSIKAFLVKSGEALEIPRHQLGFPNLSKITVSLDTYTDEILAKYTHLQLKYNNTVISEIAIQPKQAPLPVIEKDYTNRTTIVYVPPKVGGNFNFDKFGPLMKAHVELKYDSTRVYARVHLEAKAHGDGWLWNDRTEVKGDSQWIEIYNVKNGYRINTILDPMNYPNILQDELGREYIDSNYADHIMETVVGRAILIGDTDGDEAGSLTRITLNLKPFAIQIQKVW